jgi:hypothetical protein
VQSVQALLAAGINVRAGHPSVGNIVRISYSIAEHSRTSLSQHCTAISNVTRRALTTIPFTASHSTHARPFRSPAPRKQRSLSC